MYNFELVIRARTLFESEEDESFSIKVLEVSGIPIVTANEDPEEFKMPLINKTYTKYWMGRFNSGGPEIDIENVMLLKVENFPRYPLLSKPHNRAKNRVSINKIRKTKRKKSNDHTE